MAGEFLHHEDPPSFLLQICVGGMVCMCCVIFMGLKLKWFRAQIRFGESATGPRASGPVQGVGFKLRSNPDDFQSYKVISEFAPSSETTKQNSANQQNGLKKQNNTASTIKISTIANKKSPSPVHTSNNNKIQLKAKDSFNKIKTARKTVEPENNLSTNTKTSDGQIKKQQVAKETNESVTKQPVQITNPMITKNIKSPPSPKVEEENWKINIVDEKKKAKESNDYENVDSNNDPYFSTANSMYSSQAASIFFGGQTPMAPPRAHVVRNATRDDSDNESTGSQTSA